MAQAGATSRASPPRSLFPLESNGVRANDPEPMRVGLIQINTQFSGQCYLPYSVGILQAYVQRHLPEPPHFLMPVFRREPLADIVDRMKGADLTAISLYSWNERLSMAVASALKRQRPSMLIVCGGPQVPRADRPWEVREFHNAHPYVDLVVHGPGEGPFLRIVQHAHAGRWDTLPSVSFIDDSGRLVQTPLSPGFKDLSEVPEPYLPGVFDELVAAHPAVGWIAVEETNRNCPFSCTFCGWGSLGTKPILRPVEEVRRNIDWFAAHRIGYVFVADSNFGMFRERDVEIARSFARSKLATGFPRSVNVQDGKNIEEWVYRVRTELMTAGIDTPVVLALQSLHPPVLEAIQRSNIHVESYRKQLIRYAREGVPTATDILLGLPEESYESFREGVSTLLDWGQHNRSLFLNVSMVPDAAMSHPDQRRLYQIETVRTPLISPHGQLEQEEFPETQELIIATRTMPREDWVRTRAFAYTTSLLHFGKLLQIPFVLCRHYGQNRQAAEKNSGADAKPRYGDLISFFTAPALDPAEFPCLTWIRDFFLAHARSIQRGEAEYRHVPEWLNVYWPPDEFVFIRIIREGRLRQFCAEAARWIVRQVSIDERLLAQAIDLNVSMLELPYRSGTHVLDCGWNLWEVYRSILAGNPVPLLSGPRRYLVDWSCAPWRSWDEWLEKVVWWRNRSGQYYLKPEAIRSVGFPFPHGPPTPFGHAMAA